MRATRKSWIAILLAGVCLAYSGAVFADALADYEKARNDYDAGRYSQAGDRFRDMLDPDKGSALNDPVLLEQSRIYYASCMIALGNLAEADSQIRIALLANPAARPDPVVFPRAVVDRFVDVRTKIRGELNAKAEADAKKKHDEEEKLRRAREAEKARIKELEKLARQEVHVLHNSRWIASIPFGVGQFQNGQTAGGWLFLTTETSLAATSIITAAIKSSLESQAFGAGVDRAALNTQTHRLAVINWSAFGGLLLVAAGGIFHAQLTFIPEFREVRERPLPPAPVTSKLTPSIGVLPSGGFLGLQGTF
jgi:tetratricopeptide (TPR) repeat protein